MSTPTANDLHQEQAQHWERIARLSPAEMHARLALVQSLLQRLDQSNPDVLLAIRAAQGWSVEDLAAAEEGRPWQ